MARAASIPDCAIFSDTCCEPRAARKRSPDHPIVEQWIGISLLCGAPHKHVMFSAELCGQTSQTWRDWRIGAALSLHKSSEGYIGAPVTMGQCATLPFSKARSLSGGSNLPFARPMGVLAASASSFFVGSARRYISVLSRLLCPSQSDTFRTSPVASRVCIAQVCRLYRSRHRRHSWAMNT